MGINIENVLWTSAGAKVIQIIFFITIAVTLGNNADNIYWVITIITGIPLVLLSYFIFMMMKNETPRARAMLHIAFFIEIVNSTMMMFEVWFISLGDFLIDAPTGKIIAMLLSVLFVVYWCYAYRFSHNYFLDNLRDGQG